MIRSFPRLGRLAPVVCTLALIGCQTGVEDGRWATGSSTVVASADYAVVYSVDNEGGTIAAYEPGTGITAQVEVGAEPTRVARLGDRVLATVKGEREFVVLSHRDDDLEIVERVGTAAEPYGIVASEDGTRVYVAAAASGVVQEFDGETLAFLRDWRVPDEPRWLALHPAGTSLYVGSAFGGTVSRVDLLADSVSPVALPGVTGTHLVSFDPIDLTPRVTGDPAVSPDGRALAIPVLYVDNESPVGAPTPPGVPNPSGYGGGEGEEGLPGSSVSRFNPAVVTLVLDDDGLVLPEDSHAVSVASVNGDGEVVRSYATSVTYSPDGETLLVTMEASSVAVAVPAKPARVAGSDAPVPRESGEFLDFFGAGNSLEQRPTQSFLTAAGPRGATFLTPDEAFVHGFLDRALDRVALDALDIDRNASPGAATALATAARVDAYPTTLAPQLDLGRSLFYSAANRRMSAEGSGVSCSTCHLDSRNDGLTWPLEVGPRQTPSLAGEVSLTAPVTWTSDVPTVAHEVEITSGGRMGGSGLTALQREAVAAYIDYTPAPHAPRRALEDDAVTRGQAVFQREDVGCAGCHSGAAWTDNEAYDMYGVSGVRTRSLVGIAASAPYLHDGSVSDLGALLERSRDGSMGDTSSLSPAEMADLRAFLESL